ncbi:Hypothetical_protein [Hexamita inflata]|uniref:Hypothetical_protein n=1 Tax=Hexamita inflata TaxID=28002 RepID=A0AA86VKB8_9EUKA|nr:Hypothetical protein HINF_LOCUS56763 [Hexamita inflata]
MNAQQVLAQALMRTQQRLDDEMNSINVFNTNPKLLQLQSVLADLKQKQQQFQRIANDKQAHSKFANSEQDRAQQIALLNENTVEFNQKSDELAQYHAALQIQQKAEIQRLNAQIAENQKKNERLAVELQDAQANLDRETMITQKIQQSIETAFGISYAARDAISTFRAAFIKPVYPVAGQCMFQRKTLIMNLNVMQKFSSLSQQLIVHSAGELSKALRSHRFLSLFISKTMKNDLQQQIEQSLKLTDQAEINNLCVCVQNYVKSNWNPEIELAFKEFVQNEPIARNLVLQRGVKIQGSQYKTDRGDTCVAAMLCGLILIQGNELVMETLQEKDKDGKIKEVTIINIQREPGMSQPGMSQPGMSQ